MVSASQTNSSFHYNQGVVMNTVPDMFFWHVYWNPCALFSCIYCSFLLVPKNCLNKQHVIIRDAFFLELSFYHISSWFLVQGHAFEGSGHFCAKSNESNMMFFESSNNYLIVLTHCRRLAQKCVIAHPCVVDGPCISAFSYTTSNTRVFELVWHTDRFKVIVSYMQDVWISSYKQTDRSWTLF